MNSAYTIRRANLLCALGLGPKIPVGQTGTWENVEVATGHWDDAWLMPRPSHALPRTTVVLPKVTLLASGVARRIQVECPKCRKTMRFCALQQHVDTGTCKS